VLDREAGNEGTAQQCDDKEGTRGTFQQQGCDLEGQSNYGGKGDQLAPTHDAAIDQIAWPWSGISCTDSTGQALEKSTSFASDKSSINCDLDRNTAAASSSAEPLDLTPGQGIHISVGGFSFQTDAGKGSVQGAVTSTTAVVRNLEISTEGVGALHIGRIQAVALTVAHGRPGSNSAIWQRSFDQITMEDGSGKAIFECKHAVQENVENPAHKNVDKPIHDNAGSSALPDRPKATCSPDQVVDEANQLFESHIRFRLPFADREVTPKGAFAGIQKSDADYYNDLTVNNLDSRAVPALDVVVINDTVEKSRLHMQFAAIEASSIYGITQLGSFDFAPPLVQPGDLVTGQPLPPVPLPAPGGDLSRYQAPVTGPILSRIAEGALLLLRTPKQAALVGLIGLMFAGAVASVRRRQIMLEHLRK
jgi:hypothetical protein